MVWGQGWLKAFSVGGRWDFLGRGRPGIPDASLPVEPVARAHPLRSQAWAEASGRYEGYPEDPAKWKTNFRCALASTGMFKLLEDHSKCGDDPHKVFAIVPGEPGPVEGGCVGWGGQSRAVPLTPLAFQPGATREHSAAPAPWWPSSRCSSSRRLAGVGGAGQGVSPLPLLRHSTPLPVGGSQTGAPQSRGWRSG